MADAKVTLLTLPEGFGGWKLVKHNPKGRHLIVDFWVSEGLDEDEEDINIVRVETAYFVPPDLNLKLVTGMVIEYQSAFYQQKVRAVYNPDGTWTIYYNLTTGRFSSPAARTEFILDDSESPITTLLEGI